MQSRRSPSWEQTVRCRWLIVALLLVLAGAAWWEWPRGDARFVGKWKVKKGTAPTAFQTYYSNGTATSLVPGLQLSTCPWRVEGNKMIYGWSCTARTLPLPRWLAAKWFVLTGTIPYVGEDVVELTTVSEDVISYRRPAVMGAAPTPAEEFISMTRIPE
jgi:hypothetical protein